MVLERHHYFVAVAALMVQSALATTKGCDPPALNDIRELQLDTPVVEICGVPNQTLNAILLSLETRTPSETSTAPGAIRVVLKVSDTFDEEGMLRVPVPQDDSGDFPFDMAPSSTLVQSEEYTGTALQGFRGEKSVGLFWMTWT